MPLDRYHDSTQPVTPRGPDHVTMIKLIPKTQDNSISDTPETVEFSLSCRLIKRMGCRELLDQRIASLGRQQWTDGDIALATGTGRSRIADVTLNRRSAPNREGRPRLGQL
jgi:hypothetical protein